MTTATTVSSTLREPRLLGQTVVVIGGSAGIGFETARRARAEGAKLILTGRNPERLQRVEVARGALSTAAFDATDPQSPRENVTLRLKTQCAVLIPSLACFRQRCARSPKAHLPSSTVVRLPIGE